MGSYLKTNSPVTLPHVMFFKIKIGVLSFLFLIGTALYSSAQDSLLTFNHPQKPPTMAELLEWKEVFTYEVRYSFFTLGKVRTEIVRDTLHHGQKVWWLRTIITSNSGIPFVGKEENHYNTFLVKTDSLPHTQVYWRDNVDEKRFNEEYYDFDYDKQKVYVSEQGTPKDTLEVTEPASSGQLIFYYSRLFAGTDRDYRLPVYLEREKGYVNGKNSSEIEMREYDAFKDPVKTFASEGNADIDGPFGFRGRYKAWYVADDLRIPAEAHVKVWLGNVRVKLVNYEKERR